MSAPDENLMRLVRALRGPGLPQHLRECIKAGGRYVSYIEDEPMIWTQTFDDCGAAVGALRWFVAHRMAVNGAGVGAVLDLHTKCIVATSEMPMPVSTEDRSWAVQFILEKHFGR